MINPLQFDGARAIDAQVPSMTAHTARLKRQLAAQGVPAIYVNDPWPVMPWRSDFSATVAHCVRAGGAGSEMAALLLPRPEDHTMHKPRHSAFYGTPLQLLLTQLGVESLIICGLATDLCVQFSAMDAYERGFELWVPSNCTAAETPARKRAALAWMARTLKARTEAATTRALVR